MKCPSWPVRGESTACCRSALCTSLALGELERDVVTAITYGREHMDAGRRMQVVRADGIAGVVVPLHAPDPSGQHRQVGPVAAIPIEQYRLARLEATACPHPFPPGVPRCLIVLLESALDDCGRQRRPTL